MDEMMNRTAIAEPDFDFGRMDIHIHKQWIECQIEQVSRVTVSMQDIFICGTDGVGKQAVTHEAAIDIEILHIATGS